MCSSSQAGRAESTSLKPSAASSLPTVKDHRWRASPSKQQLSSPHFSSSNQQENQAIEIMLLTSRAASALGGNITELIREGATIQAQLAASQKCIDDSTLAKRFAAMVFNNNLKGAMSLVTEKGKGGILPINDGTKREMASKHPKAEGIRPIRAFRWIHSCEARGESRCWRH